MILKGKLNFLISQFKGFKTNRKIVVIESDDWGSQRVPNLAARNAMAESGIAMDQNPHSIVDTLEQESDLTALFEVFEQLKKEFPAKSPILTCNFIVGNPDYEKILATNFTTYHYEDFITTYQNRDQHAGTWNVIQDGILNKYITAQFHGREHVNVSSWMQLLRDGNKDFITAFHQGCYAIDSPTLGKYKNNLMAAFDYTTLEEQEFVVSSIKEGLGIFENHFGFPSQTAVAPRYVWNTTIERALSTNGIQSLQTALSQQIPTKGLYKFQSHYTGKKGTEGVLYTVRNAHFEPAYDQNLDWVGQVLSKARLAFLMRTPLIISTHRLNFVGGIEEENRTQNLKLFNRMLQELIRTYPDIEFLTSEELLKIILKDKT